MKRLNKVENYFLNNINPLVDKVNSDIVDYANSKNIYWCDGSSKLHKYLTISKRISRYFNDGDRCLMLSQNDIKKAYDYIALGFELYNKHFETKISQEEIDNALEDSFSRMMD